MTTRPLPDDQLEAIRDAFESLGDDEAMYSMPRDIGLLLDEVDRLRARTEHLAEEARFQGRRADEARAEASRLRAENTALRTESEESKQTFLKAIDAVNAEYAAVAAKLDAVRAIEPRPRTGLTTPTLLAEVSGWNGAVATFRAALGGDQDGGDR